MLVLERAPADALPAGASGVAAGMLAPVTEADFGEETLLGLGLESRGMWPGFAAELEERTGLSTGLRETGALVVAADRDDVEELRRLHAFQRSLGLEAEWLSPSAARSLEPGLSPGIGGAVHAPSDAHVDPPAVARALRAALELAGGELRCGIEVEALAGEKRVSGVRTAAGSFDAGHVVLAAGAWSGLIDSGPPVRPVKGQILELAPRAGSAPPPERIVRSPRCYLFARSDGRVLLGATVEEQGFDTTVTAEGVFRLLEAVREVFPEASELELVRARAGLRPGTPDNVPLIGPGEREGLVWATGHHRGGVLLAPVTGRAVEALVADGFSPDEEGPAPARRFGQAGALR